MAIKISGETVVDDSKKGLFNDVVVKGGAGESGEITLNCENNSHGVKLKGPAHSAGADYTLTLPDTSGNSGEVLTTDGSGAMSWEEVVGNEISATAPTSPSQGALWTDTSEDPAAPILKTWNGSAWVAVGSAAPSEFAPVINGVSLTENDTTGDRFTSQTFDVAIDMLIEGSPHSQKALKGEVTASFAEYPNTESISSNNVELLQNSSAQIYNTFNKESYGTTRVYARDSNKLPHWYVVTGGTSSSIKLYESDGMGTNYYNELGNYNRGADTFTGADYIRNDNGDEYIVAHPYYRGCGSRPAVFTRNDNDNGGQWREASFNDYFAPPVYDDQYDVWWTCVCPGATANLEIRKGNELLYNSLGVDQETNVVTNQSGMIVMGTDRIVVGYRRSTNGYIRTNVYSRDANSPNKIGEANVDTNSNTLQWLYSAGSWFFMSISDQMKRSQDGINWSDVPFPSGGWVSSTYEILYNSASGLYELFTKGSSDTVRAYTSNNAFNWVEVKSQSVISSFSEADFIYGGGQAAWVGVDSNTGRYYEVYFPFNKQTLTLSGTGADYSEFNVGDPIRPAGSTDPGEVGTITSISGTTIGIASDYIYQVGDSIEALYPTSSAVSTRYLIIEASGNITGTVGADPGFVNVGPDVNQTLTFPATFPSGDTPDEELPAGTTIKVSAQATNSEGSSEYGPSNIVTPS